MKRCIRCRGNTCFCNSDDMYFNPLHAYRWSWFRDVVNRKFHPHDLKPK